MAAQNTDMTREDFVDFLSANMTGDTRRGPIAWQPGALDEVRAALDTLPLGPPLTDVLEELAALAMYVKNPLQSEPAAVELLTVLDQAAAREANRLIEAETAQQADQAKAFAQWTGLPAKNTEEPKMDSPFKSFKVPRNISG